ncbi:MAG TPA: hypothetical protein VMH82_04520 [Myxococcota bacterium]|nr:hypothetical protein [Myxococcota bacterium]
MPPHERPSDLDERRHALESAFFGPQGEPLRARLQLAQDEEEAKKALAGASGITDAELLRRLVGLGIRVETLAALTLIPLVEVAWADGHMDRREREAVLRGAESCGIEPGTPSHGLLEIWTQDRPASELMPSWKAFMKALCSELSADQRRHLEEKIVGRARAVAEAAGGFLGLVSKVSREEAAVLDALEEAFIL